MGTDPQPLLKTAQPSQPTTKENSKLKEYMAVMQPMKGPAWVNEAPAQPPLTQESGSYEGEPQGPLSDLEWMRQRMSRHVDQEDRVFEQSDEEVQDDNPVCLRIFLYIFS
jgi:multiple RNA-binding domain-containing protein 1